MGRLANKLRDSRTKRCIGPCGKDKRADEFYTNMRYKSRRDPYCKACRAASAKAWRKDHPEGWAAQVKRHRAKKAGKKLCPLCETYSIKAAAMADMLSGHQDLLDALLAGLGRVAAMPKWCDSCGNEHVGKCALRFAPGYRRCAVAGCTRAELKGEEQGRCAGCARAGKSVPRRGGQAGMPGVNDLLGMSVVLDVGVVSLRGAQEPPTRAGACPACMGQGWVPGGRVCKEEGAQFEKCGECGGSGMTAERRVAVAARMVRTAKNANEVVE